MRLHKGDDLRTAVGLAKGMKAIKVEDAGHVALWVSLPCTWGAGCRHMNKGMAEGSDTINFEKAQRWLDRSAELWDDFAEMFPHTVILAHEVASKGGDIIMEWPSGNSI